MFGHEDELQKEIEKLRAQNKKLVEALTSISKNSCCETCQQAKLVAIQALDEVKK